MKMKTLFMGVMIGVFSVIFFTVQAKACVTILCEAVCAQYKLTPNEVKLGKNGSDGTFRGQDYYKLVSRKAVYADGEKGYTQIFEQLKKKCDAYSSVLPSSGGLPFSALPSSALTSSISIKSSLDNSSSCSFGRATALADFKKLLILPRAPS